MTSIEYGHAYQAGFASTVRLLVERGVEASQAEELAQEAWARGWEKTLQGTQPLLWRTWINLTAIHLSGAGKISGRGSQPLVELSRLLPKSAAPPAREVKVFSTVAPARMLCVQHSPRSRRQSAEAPGRRLRQHRANSF
jgi:DNA-directed RNA polymerase specialized sigma24 family protein